MKALAGRCRRPELWRLYQQFKKKESQTRSDEGDRVYAMMRCGISHYVGDSDGLRYEPSEEKGDGHMS